MEKVKKTAEDALGSVLDVMKKRLDKVNELEGENIEEAAKIIKNDELIKIAKFVLEIIEREDEKAEAGRESGGGEGGEVRVILDDEVKQWAR